MARKRLMSESKFCARDFTERVKAHPPLGPTTHPPKPIRPTLCLKKGKRKRKIETKNYHINRLCTERYVFSLSFLSHTTHEECRVPRECSTARGHVRLAPAVWSAATPSPHFPPISCGSPEGSATSEDCSRGAALELKRNGMDRQPASGGG